MNNKRKSNCIVYLIFGIIITSLATTVTLSRFMTEISGIGTISVATINADVTTLTFIPTNLNKPGATETMRFNVTNYIDEHISEVDQNYSITVNTTDNLPFIYKLQCINTGGNGTGINITNSEIDTKIQLSGGLLNHSIRTTHEYVLTIIWPNSLKEMSFAEELELITILIDSEQALN